MSESTSSDDERLLSPTVVERKTTNNNKAAGAKIQEPTPPNGHSEKYNVAEYASFLCRGHRGCQDYQSSDEAEKENNATRLVVLDESVMKNFDEHVQTLSARTPAEGGAHVRVVLMNRDNGTFLQNRMETLPLLEKYWAIDMEDIALLTSHLVSSYHSRIVDVNGDMCLDISYNIREDILYDVDNISPLWSSLTINVSKPTDMRVQHEYEPLFFRHNINTGQTTYILPDASRDNCQLLHNVAQKLTERATNSSSPTTPNMQIHPFTLHAVILFQSLAARNVEIDDLYRRLLWIETQIYQGSIFQGMDSQKFIRYIQLSHKLSRNLITLEHRNKRDRSHIEKLLGDHKRLWRLIAQGQRPSPGISRNHDRAYYYYMNLRTSHEHVRDSLLSLKDFSLDQERQVLNAQRKSQLFITLLYNLITGHDSGINLRIASETAKVAHEAKKDSTSMKIIAGVTMIYLPATFVCSLFGTNFVALNTSANGSDEPIFVVSKLWWVYIAFAVPLTLATIVGFLIWRRWRRGRDLLEDKYKV